MLAVMIVALIGSLWLTGGVLASNSALFCSAAGLDVSGAGNNGNNNSSSSSSSGGGGGKDAENADCGLSNPWNDQDSDYYNGASWYPSRIATLMTEAQNHFCTAPNGAPLPEKYPLLAQLAFDAYRTMVLLFITGQGEFQDPLMTRLNHQPHADAHGGSGLLSIASQYKCAVLENFIASWRLPETQAMVRMAFENLEPSLADRPLWVSLQMLLSLVIRKRRNPGHIQSPEEVAHFIRDLGETCAAAKLVPSQVFAVKKWLLATWLVLFDRGNCWAEPEALMQALTAHLSEYLLEELPVAEGELLRELLRGEDGQLDHAKTLKHLVFALHWSAKDRREEEQAVKALGGDDYRGRTLGERVRALQDWLRGDLFLQHVEHTKRMLRLRGLLLRQMRGVIFENYLDSRDFDLPYLQRIGELLQELVEEFHGSPLPDQHAETLQQCLTMYDASLDTITGLWDELQDLRPPQSTQSWMRYVIFSPHALHPRVKSARSGCNVNSGESRRPGTP